MKPTPLQDDRLSFQLLIWLILKIKTFHLLHRYIETGIPLCSEIILLVESKSANFRLEIIRYLFDSMI
jgi:hypothetical protein